MGFIKEYFRVSTKEDIKEDICLFLWGVLLSLVLF